MQDRPPPRPARWCVRSFFTCSDEVVDHGSPQCARGSPRRRGPPPSRRPSVLRPRRCVPRPLLDMTVPPAGVAVERGVGEHRPEPRDGDLPWPSWRRERARRDLDRRRRRRPAAPDGATTRRVGDHDDAN